jgi:hypothetical protein
MVKSKTKKTNKTTKKASAKREEPTAKQKAEYNEKAQSALEDALSGVLTSWRTIPEVIAVVDAAVKEHRRYALEHYYRENVESFIDDSGFDEEEYEGDEPMTEEQWEVAIDNAVADYVGDLEDYEVDETLADIC